MNDRERRSAARFLAGGGEMGERTRSFDWSRTPVGPIERWPQSLKTIVRTMLDSRYAMWLGWGSEFTFFYNDAYARMTLGAKHPWALGRSAREVWREIWADIGPRAESVLRTGEATWDEGLLLFLERRGRPEETYHTFSYSPVPDDAGAVGGMLCVVTEETERRIGERRLRSLRELAARTMDEARSAEAACETAAGILAANPHDVPFALLYLLDRDGRHVKLAGSAGLAAGGAVAPAAAELGTDGDGWPFRQVIETSRPVEVADVPARFGALACGVWPESPEQAIVLPLARPGEAKFAGFVVAGVSPRRPFDDAYRGFFELVAGQIGIAVASARAYEEARRRAEALAELDHAKTAFFSNVSHEFRTPLTLILGPVEDLIDAGETELSAAARERLELVHRNGLRLLRLVNSLLDFSRIEAGRVRALYQPTDLGAFTAEVASVFRSACERAGLRLDVDCAALSAPVHVDREMWEKIVLNLVSNAFKFTFDGGIEVTLREAGGAAELRVRDTGTGIPGEHMPRLFERFHRIESTRGRTHEGSGIGLALVHELVKLHGGSVTAESELGRGTTFVVSLPLGSAHLPPDRIGEGGTEAHGGPGASAFVEEALRWLPEREATEHERRFDSADDPPIAVPAETGERSRVLVADDNADMRRYVVRLLADRYDVEAVADGEAALAAIRGRTPDLVLSDVMMPRLDGFGLLGELRADPRTRALPVILLSARAGEESRIEGMESGADDYLVKPFSARELLARVGAHLQIARLRRESERAIRDSEERFRLFMAHSPTTAFIKDADGRYLYVNRMIERTFERPIEEWIGKTDFDVFPPEEAERLRRNDLAVLEGGATAEFEESVTRRDGLRHYVTFKFLLPDPAGRALLAGMALDVTERRRAEAALRETEHRFRLVADAANDAIWDWDLVTDESIWSDGLRTQFGHASGRHDAASSWWAEKIHAEDRDGVLDTIHAAIDAGDEIWTAEYRFRRADGSYAFVFDRGRVVRDESGRPVRMVGSMLDLSERKRAEDLVAENERRFRTLVEQVEDYAIFTTDPSGRATSWNVGVERVLGYPEVDFLGRDVTREIFTPEDVRAGVPERELAEAAAAGTAGNDRWMRRRDGTRFFANGATTGLRDERGELIGFMKVMRDQTERWRLEEELRQVAADLSRANRRQTEFLATLGHELRNPLAPIRTGLELLRMVAGDPSRIERTRAMMERQTHQLVRLLDDLLDLSRITQGKLQLRTCRVELADVIASAVEASRPGIDGAGHELAVDVPAEPIFLEADPTRLAQVVSNLLSNATKYTTEGGHLRVAVEKEGDEVVVAVTDDGIGIPADMQGGIFDMFAQIDRPVEKGYRGLGIGLTLVKRLVEMHGGSVGVRSDGEGRGSVFRVRLPIASDPPVAPEPLRPDVSAGRRRARVLVVDDNEAAADTLGMVLTMLGTEVRTAYDGLQGVEAAAEFRPDLVLMDLRMPRMSGYEAAGRIRAEDWGRAVRLVALTGWGQDEDRQRTRAAGFDRHLVKPAEPADLQRLLEEID